MHIEARLTRRCLREQSDEGFTLIELLVVLLIIGILLAIAIPTFLSTTKSANDTGAKANLNTANTASTSYYTQANETYSGINTGGLSSGLGGVGGGVSAISQIDVGLTFVTTASTAANVISLWTDNDSAVVMAAYAAGTKNCWVVIDLKAQATTPVWGETAVGTYYDVVPNISSGTCVAGQTAITGAVGAQTGGYPAP